jgi:ferric-dicitrate binding protein FerR (iron transport regulator)
MPRARSDPRSVRGVTLVIGSAFAAVLAGTCPGIARSPNAAAPQVFGCTVTAYADPPREVLHCADGVEIVAERAARYELVPARGRRGVTGARLNAGGLLVTFPPARRGGFKVITPHAVASVRGTTWAVDVRAARSSVFVREGSVAVSRRGSPRAVVLRAGDGVDVEADTAPLRVNRWGRERVLHLLARFGR